MSKSSASLSCLASAGLHPRLLFDKSTELNACCEERSAAAAHDAILFTLFRIDDRRRVANGTGKFLWHGVSFRSRCTTVRPEKRSSKVSYARVARSQSRQKDLCCALHPTWKHPHHIDREIPADSFDVLRRRVRE